MLAIAMIRTRCATSICKAPNMIGMGGQSVLVLATSRAFRFLILRFKNQIVR